MNYPKSSFTNDHEVTFWRNAIMIKETLFMINVLGFVALFIALQIVNPKGIYFQNWNDYVTPPVVFYNIGAFAAVILTILFLRAYIFKRTKEEALNKVFFKISNNNDTYLTYVIPDMIEAICVDGFSLKVDENNHGLLSIYVPNKSPDRVKKLLDILRKNDISVERDIASDENIFASEHK